MQLLTLSPTNQLSFVCPIFDTEVRMAGCVKLRNLFWQGKVQTVRRGCQACMSAGKCPAAQVVQGIAMGRTQDDPYGSTSTVTVRLKADVLDHVLPIVVSTQTLQHFGVPGAEQRLIESAYDRIAKQLVGAPTTDGKRATVRASADPTPRKTIGGTPRKMAGSKAAAPVSSEISNAAASGDLSAALNQGKAE